jgi:hypothetical protein
MFVKNIILNILGILSLCLNLIVNAMATKILGKYYDFEYTIQIDIKDEW